VEQERSKTVTLEQRLRDVKIELADVLAQLNSKNAAETNASELKSLTDKLSIQAKNLEKLIAEKKDLKAQISTLEAQLKEGEDSNQSIQQQIVAIQTELKQQHQTEIQKFQAALDEKTANLEKLKARQNDLKQSLLDKENEMEQAQQLVQQQSQSTKHIK